MNNISAHSKAAKVYRIVQWASGRIGQSAMRATINHPQRELVGVYVHSKDKSGRDAGELCGVDPIGVKATCDIKDVIALKPDCVFYMQEGYNLDDMCSLLEAGINIITTRSEFFYPKLMDTQMRKRLESACKKGGASLFATGASPGFSSEYLPLTMAYLSRQIDCLTIDEFADIPASTTPEMITEGMGFGKPKPDEFNPHIIEHIAVGFKQSLGAVAEGLGLEIDDYEAGGEFSLANSPVTLPGGAVIETGTVAAMRITIAGKRAGTTLLQYRTNWYCSKDIDQDWELSENGWRLLIEGDTPMKVEITFPSSATSAKAFADQMSGLTGHPPVNAVPYVCEAAPGLLTHMDLPLILPTLG